MVKLPAQGPRRADFIFRPHKNAKLPAPGSFMRSPSGKSVYRVLGAKLLRTAGAKQDELRFRLTCVRSRASDVPEGAVIAPWPAAPPRPVQKPGARHVERSIPSVSAIRRSKFEAARAERDRAAFDTDDPIVPAALSATILGSGGEVLRGPLIRDSSWWDPEDMDRSTKKKKLVRGKRRVDPIEWLARRNSAITTDHVLAADLYRKAAERISRSLQGWHMDASGRGGGSSSGVSDERCAAAKEWRKLQEHVGDPRARNALEYIVLEGNPVTKWADKVGMAQRGTGIGYLIAILDRLVEYFEHELANQPKSLEEVA